ncbi:MAG: pyridoxal 5'-phosphate synthase lyase subunit PdxS [Firmicutes bacterium]|jgi:pyridoxal 5'-phosphate synthase pdxS subunit|nr:pyridoxal 5'-phosphate synthase lyase subunit PdxS [Bacillota bacterium]
MKETGAEKMVKGIEIKKRGVIMDVTTPEQARIAEEAGAVAVMALERVPADIRAAGGVARMADPEIIVRIMEAVDIPVMAKVRIGHIAEAQILEEIGVDYIDESEVLTPVDEVFHLDKHNFKVPFVCGARDLGEALRRLSEGASMIRTKGEPGTGNVVEAVRHIRCVNAELRQVMETPDEELVVLAKQMGVSIELLKLVKKEGRLPVANFAAGGIATPADASLMMQLGSDGIFVGSGIFKSDQPAARAAAIVKATLHYDDPSVLVNISRGLGEAMKGMEISSLDDSDRMQERGV